MIEVDISGTEFSYDMKALAMVFYPETVSYTHLDVYKRQGIMTVVLLFGKPIARWGKRLEEIMHWWRQTLQNGVKRTERKLQTPIPEIILRR